MRQYFETIKDFISIKDECPFCSHKLVPILTNYTFQNKIPLVNSKLNNDQFTFNFKYNSYNLDIISKGNLDINSNLLNFDIDESSTENAHEHIEGAFLNLYPHIELSCINRKCKTNYYISSSIFYSFNFKIFPVSIADECCNLSSYFILNPSSKDYSNIYTKNNNTPIQTQYIDFNTDKDKIINRIKTIIAFG